MGTLTPTLAAITATDRLINLLVYWLYGLMDDGSTWWRNENRAFAS